MEHIVITKMPVFKCGSILSTYPIVIHEQLLYMVIYDSNYINYINYLIKTFNKKGI